MPPLLDPIDWTLRSVIAAAILAILISMIGIECAWWSVQAGVAAGTLALAIGDVAVLAGNFISFRDSSQ